MKEGTVRELVHGWAAAIGAKDLERVMAVYAPDVVSFDLEPPLRYAGSENKRRAWERFFAEFPGAVSYELTELGVEASEDTAFVHSLNHVKGGLAGGHVADMWVRWTACLRRVEGEWRVVHDHASVPAEVAAGRAALKLQP